MRCLHFMMLGCILLFSNCTSAQKKQHMEASHANNPHYSRTDTKPLNVSNEEWKKILLNLMNNRHRLSNEDEVIIKKIANKL